MIIYLFTKIIVRHKVPILNTHSDSITFPFLCKSKSSAIVLKYKNNKYLPLLNQTFFTLSTMGRKRGVKASKNVTVDVEGANAEATTSKTNDSTNNKNSNSKRPKKSPIPPLFPEPNTSIVPESYNRLTRDFFNQESIPLSRALLGKVIVRRLSNGQILRGTITETEAYPGSAEAEKIGCHYFITKQTEKNIGIFSIPGTTWVYMTYGVFNMLNISAQGDGSAALIRAIEPKEDYEIMHQFRHQKKQKTNGQPPPPPPTNIKRLKLYELGNGPGKLCKVLNIEKSTCDQLDLATTNLLWIEPNEDPGYQEGNFTIVEATRIGIDRAPESSRKDLYRFYIQDNYSVSTAKPSLIKAKFKESSN